MLWNAYILAGGASTRMGRDKSMLEIDGTPLLQHALCVLLPLAADVAVVGNHPHLLGFARVVEDVFRGRGPLAGIHAALLDSNLEWNLVYAVDQLWQDPHIFHFLAQHAESAPPDCLVVAPQVTHHVEPLCAFYRKSFVQLAARALEAGEYKIGDLFPQASAIVLDEQQLHAAGLNTHMLNVNTPADYSAALNKPEAAKH